MSIRARLLLLILFATLTPVIVVGVNFLEYRESEIAVARRQLSAMAQYIAKDLSDTIRGTAQLHYGLSRARDLETLDKAACSAFLAAVLKAHPQYTGILTITPAGDLFCDSLRTGKALHLTDRRYFQQAVASEDPLALEPAFGRLTGIAVLQIAYAARYDTGELKFVQLASLNLEKYSQSRSTNLPFESAVLALMDSKGTMLAWHPGGEKLRGTSFADSPLYRLVRGREGGQVFEDIEVGGTSRVWATTTLSGFPGAGLYILIGVSKADLVAAANKRLNRALGVLGVFLLLALAGAWALAELGVRRPSARIIAAVARFSRGDFGARIGKPHPRGEIGDLMAALDHAFELMQTQRDVIQGLNADLERRVAERTAQLATANRELEEQYRRVQQANRLKSEFLANMSHELRTPLNGIIGFAELMHDGRVGPVSAEHKEYLGDILTSARHLLQLINDVLDLAKVESGKMEFRPERVDLAQIIGETRDILRTLAAQKRIAVSMDVDPDVPWAELDPAKFKQVLYNYLSNALKFTPDEGRVMVRVSSEGPDHFRLEVEDSGIGIRPEDLGRLFVEFQQLDASAAKKYPGTGLGLALTKQVVEAQGGRVGMESVPGQGSTFSAVLPRVARIAPAAEAEAPAAVVPAGRPGAPTVLVIEDDAKDRAWLTRTLADAGFNFQTAATGAEAVARCRVQAFEAITLDLILPDMIGWDLLRQIRAEGPNRETPVIVVTVVTEKSAAIGFEIQDFLIKPVTEEQLIGSLERAGLSPDGANKVLIVDDDPAALKVAETALRGARYHPMVSPDGAAGLRAAEAEHPDAVILDLLMPGMDGFQFLESFRRTPWGRRTPVIIWTVKDLTGEERARLQAAAQAIVLKGDGAPARLVEEIRNHLGPARTAPAE